MYQCTKKCIGMMENYRDIGTLVLRVILGLILTMHGWIKITAMGGIPGVTGFLTMLGFPLPSVFAVILIAVEFIGGIALILGLFTHMMAKLAMIVALVAFFTVHMSKGFLIQGGGYEFIILIFAASFSLMFSGAGKYSLDHLWCGKMTGLCMCGHCSGCKTCVDKIRPGTQTPPPMQNM